MKDKTFIVTRLPTNLVSKYRNFKRAKLRFVNEIRQKLCLFTTRTNARELKIEE